MTHLYCWWSSLFCWLWFVSDNQYHHLNQADLILWHKDKTNKRWNWHFLIRLTSPSGTESQLLALRPLDNSISGLSDFCQTHIYITEISVEIDFFNPNIPIYWYWDQVFKLPHLAPNVHPLLGRKASGQVNIFLLHSYNKQQKGTNHGLKIKLITTGGVLKCGTLAVGRLTFAVGGLSSTAPSNHTIKFSTKQLDRRSVTLNRQLTGLIVWYQTNNSRSERNRSERKNLKE